MEAAMSPAIANGFWMRKQMTDSTSIEAWMQNRKKKLMQHQSLTHLALFDSSPDINKAANEEPRITLDELSDLYRRAGTDPDPDVDAAIPPEELEAKSTVSSAAVKMRIKGADGGRKIINRLSCTF